MSKNIEKILEEAQNLADEILDNITENEISEVPNKNPENQTDELEDEMTGEPTDKNKETFEEDVKNFMPEVPKTSGKPGVDIVKAITTAINPKLPKVPNTEEPGENELPSGETPDSVKQSVNQMTKDIAESILNYIDSKKKV